MNALIVQTRRRLRDFGKKLFLRWDPDFTKLTPIEKRRIKKSEKEMQAGLYFSEKDVWK